jgi:hypothetical protein
LREIVDGGGEACICEAGMVDGLSDLDIRAQFDEVRDAGCREIAAEARTLAGIAMAHEDDDARLERSAPVFDDLLPYFHRKRRAAAKPLRRESRP